MPTARSVSQNSKSVITEKSAQTVQMKTIAVSDFTFFPRSILPINLDNSKAIQTEPNSFHDALIQESRFCPKQK